jgi:predicted N-acetyltransferase YhbS
MRRMEIVEFGLLSPERRAELEGDEGDPFDAAGATLRYRRKERHVAVRDDHGRLVASTGLVLVEAEVAGERFPVFGLGGVIVAAAHRGRGLAREVVGATLARAAELGPAFALLFCHDDRAGLYRKLGFAHVEAEVRVRQPEGYAPMRDRTMWRALRPGASWPRGELVIHSLPF